MEDNIIFLNVASVKTIDKCPVCGYLFEIEITPPTICPRCGGIIL